MAQEKDRLKQKIRTLPQRNSTRKQIAAYAKNPANKPRLDFLPTGTDPQPKNSGKSNMEVSEEILGGSRAKKMQFPWQIFLEVDGIWVCGGSIISKNWALTAAHCAYQASIFVVSAGGIDIKRSETGEQKYTSYKAIVHQNYSDKWLINDVAVIQVALVLDEFVGAIRLPKQSQASNQFAGVTVTASGYGITRNNGDVSRFMNFVNLQTITNAKCAESYGADFIISSIICTGAHPTKSVCSGDSGGPLMYKETDGKYTQIGVVSFGAAYSCNKYPAGYSRVTSFLGWISANTNIKINK
ncbi:brachyurin-like [Neocloeon triangulifer]|uniref:brachyurin-like n=1 Tax=Neocloeon triangulifer TaxID=2078957 RepID=UPI00286EE3D3|nr:brachyurin-like [Neocloeon triangulifer]